MAREPVDLGKVAKVEIDKLLSKNIINDITLFNEHAISSIGKFSAPSEKVIPNTSIDTFIYEGDLSLKDPLTSIFFISDGLLTLMDDKYKVRFARYIAEIASEMPDDLEVPEFFVENELRHWLNEKFLLDPPLAPKRV